jgi:hypothetical protein
MSLHRFFRWNKIIIFSSVGTKFQNHRRREERSGSSSSSPSRAHDVRHCSSKTTDLFIENLSGYDSRGVVNTDSPSSFSRLEVVAGNWF